MSTPSRFDLVSRRNTTELALDIDQAVVVEAYQSEQLVARYIKVLAEKGVFLHDQDSARAVSRYTLNAEQMGRFRNATQAVIQSYDWLYNSGYEVDRTLPAIKMSPDFISHTCRYGMSLTLRWPDIDADVAAILASQHMRQFAATLPIHRKFNPLKDQGIYTRANRRCGVVLQTNEMGSCSVESDHRDYTENDTVKLLQHNLYNPEQQLICLVGAIAFAHADQLLE